MCDCKKILVTGATGFIGSNLLASLEEKGYNDVVCVDNFICDKWKNVAKRKIALEFILPEQLKDYLDSHTNSVKAIVHLGGISSTTEKDVDEIVRTNIQLTIMLYAFCLKNNIQFIYASSASTYGDGNEGFKDCEDICYLTSLRPQNAYGWSKKCVDVYIQSKGGFNNGSQQVVGLKFFNVYGPNEYHKGNQISTIYQFFRQYKDNGRIKLFKSYRDGIADGQQKRDFVFVSDCVDVIVWMLEHEKVTGLFNVGTGNARTFFDVAHNITDCCGGSADILYIDMPNDIKEHYQYFTQADLTKLRKVGYNKKFTSLEEGVALYIKKYLTNIDNYV